MSSLGGRLITRVDRPLPDLICLSLSGPPPSFLLLTPDADRGFVALASRRPRGASVDGLGLTLRRVLEGAVIESVRSYADGVAVVTRTPAGERSLLALDDGRERGWQLRDEARRLVGVAIAPGEELATAAEDDVLIARGRAFAEAIADDALRARRAEMRRRAVAIVKRLERSAAAAMADALRVDEAEGLRRDADALVAFAPDDDAGRDAIVLRDPHSESGATRTVQLDRRSGPRTHATRLYGRARKLERGVGIALERSARLTEEAERMRGVREAIADADDAALDALRDADPRLEPEEPRPAARSKRSPRRPYREFVSELGARILVGRGAADNDELTLRHAGKRDLFLHARGVAGAHVILCAGPRPPSDADVLDAATLAVHFSPSREEPVVEVLVAERRHVHKPRGYPAGAVRVERERVIALRMEGDRRARLLAAERPLG